MQRHNMHNTDNTAQYLTLRLLIRTLIINNNIATRRPGRGGCRAACGQDKRDQAGVQRAMLPWKYDGESVALRVCGTWCVSRECNGVAVTCQIMRPACGVP